MVELDVRSWQETLINYEGKNQYLGYDPCKKKVHIIHDVFVDEQHLYHRETLNN